MHLARNLVLKNHAFTAKHGPVTEHTPGQHLESDEELATAAGNIATSIFHPVSRAALIKIAVYTDTWKSLVRNMLHA
jgi:hypothetical protein